MRIALALLALFSALFFPAYITAALMILSCIRYPAYEMLFVGLLTDFLWHPAGLHLPYFTLIALIALWGFAPLRKEFMPR